MCVTAYDAVSGSLADEAGVDLVLVGDSVGNVLLGYASTIPVTLQEMIHHTRATASRVSRALLVADMPFGSYQSSVEKAVESAVALVKAGAQAVKLEGVYRDAIRAIGEAGIPVMGHVGMTPQSLHRFGGFRVQGKGDAAAAVLADALATDEAGVFSLVLELVPSDLAREITTKVSCPTIGIGAGSGCDGQIQVFHDLLGLSGDSFKHVKTYVRGRDCLMDGLRAYADEVRSREFPGPEHSF